MQISTLDEASTQFSTPSSTKRRNRNSGHFAILTTSALQFSIAVLLGIISLIYLMAIAISNEILITKIIEVFACDSLFAITFAIVFLFHAIESYSLLPQIKYAATLILIIPFKFQVIVINPIKILLVKATTAIIVIRIIESLIILKQRQQMAAIEAYYVLNQ